MKKVMHLSISLLCLSVSLLIGFQVGVRNAEGQPSNPFSFWYDNAGLTDSGETWFLINESTCWQRDSGRANAPVATSEISFWAVNYLVTKSGDGWVYNAGRWTNCGTPQGGVAVAPTTWGKLKTQYKGN